MKKKILILDDYKPIKKVFVKRLKKYSLTFKTFKKNKDLSKYLTHNKFYAIYSAFGYKLDRVSKLDNNIFKISLLPIKHASFSAI